MWLLYDKEEFVTAIFDIGCESMMIHRLILGFRLCFFWNEVYDTSHKCNDDDVWSMTIGYSVHTVGRKTDCVLRWHRIESVDLFQNLFFSGASRINNESIINQSFCALCHLCITYLHTCYLYNSQLKHLWGWFDSIVVYLSFWFA